MKNIILFLCLVCSSAAIGQQYSGIVDLGKMKPGKMIFGEGTTSDVDIQYQMPELFKNPQNKFTISMLGGAPYVHSGGIEAFTVDGNIWILRNVPVKTEGYAAGAQQFVILTRQGAIEQYSYVFYGKPSDEPNMAYTDLFKNRLRIINRKVSTNEFVEGALSDEQIKAWIADSPEAMEDLKKAEEQAAEAKKMHDTKNTESSTKQAAPKGKLSLLDRLENASVKDSEQKQVAALKIDLYRILNNYNAYYEEQNRGKIKYYFASAPSPTSLPALTKPVKTREEMVAENEARKDAMFAGRSATPSPEFASAKDNVPEKKETFAAKMSRIKSDGNKIGVLLVLKPVMVPKTEAAGGTMMNQALPSNAIAIEGEYLDETLRASGAEFVAELNAALGTSAIELIDIKDVPYRDTKLGRIDDWWSSKFKVVFIYTVDPRLNPTHEEIGGKNKFMVTLNMVTSLLVMEYIGGPGSTKQKIEAQVLNMGSFVTPSYAQDEDMTNVEEIYRKTLEKLGTPIMEKMKTERADAVTKLVEKKLK